MGGNLRIALFGGSFDPVHNGHLHLALSARKENDLSVVIFVPAKTPPHKLKHKLTPVAHRLRMLSLALRPHPYFGLSHYEVNQKTTTYTYQTVTHFKELYPSAELYFIIGSDSLAELHTWKQIAVLQTLCTFLVGRRAGTPQQEPAFMPQSTRFIEEPMLPTSSTEVRKLVSRGESIEHLVAPSIDKYISEHGLYR